MRRPAAEIAAALPKHLGSIGRPGDFRIGDTRPAFLPAIDLEGAGRIAFPVLPAQAERLIAIAEAAPHGRGTETVVAPPSAHSGGELVVRHLGREVTLDLRPDDPAELGFAAFHADCVHEVRPVASGYRLTLSIACAS
jgi:hypothetical protein